MIKTATIETAFLASLVSVMAALALLLVTSPAAAAPRDAAMKERIVALCAVSDTDLTGKRLARDCRKQVRAEAKRTVPTSAGQDPKLAAR